MYMSREALFFIGKRTTLRPKRTSMGEKVEKLNFHVHVCAETASVPDKTLRLRRDLVVP